MIEITCMSDIVKLNKPNIPIVFKKYIQDYLCEMLSRFDCDNLSNFGSILLIESESELDTYAPTNASQFLNVGLITENNKTFDFTQLFFFEKSYAKIEYVKIRLDRKNALDFQLASILGYKIAKNGEQEFVIVSKDKGYDSTVEFWKGKKIQISRVENITTDVQNSKNEIIQEINSLVGKENEKYSPIIHKALSERKSKEGIHNYLMKELHDNKKVTELYKKIKPLLKGKS